MAHSIPSYTLAGTGDKVSYVGLGTFAVESEEDSVRTSTLAALKCGYRHIDTAEKYGCEGQVGQALRESGIPRKDVVVTTKFWNSLHHPEGVKQAAEISLKNLGLDYIDLFLMHWPVACPPDPNEPTKEQRDAEGKLVIDHELTNNHGPTWKAMEDLVRSGKVRNIGVSNFNSQMIKNLLPQATIPIAANQVECHPWLQQSELRQVCKENNIFLIAYSPLGSQGDPLARADTDQKLMNDPTVKEIASKNGITAGQALLSWGVMKGHGVIPKSSNEGRIKQNLEGAAFRLPQEDFDTITKIGDKGQYRLVDFSGYFNDLPINGNDRQYP